MVESTQGNSQNSQNDLLLPYGEQTSDDQMLKTNSLPYEDPQIVNVGNIHLNMTVKDQQSQNQLSIPGGVSCGPYSFADPRDQLPVEKPCPPPKYQDRVMLTKPLPQTKTEILQGQGLVLRQDGCLECTDAEILEKQNGVLGHVFKEFTAKLLQGQPISAISLPIKIFEPRSTIQRTVDFLTQAPIFLRLAAEEKDPVERLKYIVTFGLSSLYLCSGQNKPFNPLLGETHQGSFVDGTKFYLEHTSHHPPISNFLLENDQYRMWGYYEIMGKMGANNLVSGLRGPTHIEFLADGSRVSFNAPDFKLGGTLYGERTIECIGSQVFHDVTNGVKAVVILSTYKEEGMFNKTVKGSRSGLEGMIYRVKDDKNKLPKFGRNMGLPESLKDVKDCKEKLCDISGSWMEQIIFDQKVYWDIDDMIPLRQVPLIEGQPLFEGHKVLASDWRHREDLLWLKYGFMEVAANWKLKLEVQQRKDRKNRQEATKRREKGN